MSLSGRRTAMRRWARLLRSSEAVLEQRQLHGVVALGDADALAEVPDRLRRVPAAAQASDGGRARIVPAADVAALDELQQLALAHHRVGEVEPGELDLLRMEDSE